MAASKVVLITGGNTGIGYEAVKALLQSDKPYHVLMGSRSMDKARVAIDSLREECPQSKSAVEAVQVDVTDDGSIEQAFEQVKASRDRVDTLINNAGMRRRSVLDRPQAHGWQGRRSTWSSWRARCRCANASPRRTTSTWRARRS